MLLASYRTRGKPVDDTLLAAAPPRAAPAPVMLAAASRPRSPAVDFSIADDAPVVLTPGNARARLKQVLPFESGQTPILRASLTSSYAPDDVAAGPAQAAAARLVRPAVPKPARVIQLGVFSDPANAARVAGQFGRYGDVSMTANGRLKVVRVSITDPAVSTESVVAAAGDAGLAGASLVAQ
jgi:hypothetical protein